VDDLRLLSAPVAKTGMLIRRPVTDVFEAFVDRAITTKFWFAVSARVVPHVIEPNRRILLEGSGDRFPAGIDHD
jgi:uncharacterized protein YndB with AHSA1/START domain